jgi:hypothetical protein
MNKPKLLIFSQQFSDCPLSEIIFKTDFLTEVVETTEELKNKINNFNPDAIIAGFCQAQVKILFGFNKIPYIFRNYF